MPNVSKSVSDIVKALSERAKNVADIKTNPKSFYAKLPQEEQIEAINRTLGSMVNLNKVEDFNEEDFIKSLTDQMNREIFDKKLEQDFIKNQKAPEPDLHSINYDLERQADDFLRENDPEFFEELNNAMKNYDENTTSMPRDEMVEQIADQLDNFYDNDMSEAFKNALANQSRKDFIKNLYADELDNSIENVADNTKNLDKALMQYHLDYLMNDPSTRPHVTSIIKDANKDPLDPNNYEQIYNKPARLTALEEQIKYNLENKNKTFNNNSEEDALTYHLSKDPLENASEIEFPDTSLNRRYHNVAMPRGKYYFEGQHKPADYYHNILWNYINKGENKDALLDEFFEDIVKNNIDNKVDKQFYLREWLRPAEKDRLYKQALKDKYQIVNKYKNVLNKRRHELDMKNIPFDKHKLNHMKDIEEYFNSLRPESFENFESSILSPSDKDIPIYNEIIKYRNDDKNQFLTKTPKEIREKNKQNTLIKEQFRRLLNNLE